MNNDTIHVIQSSAVDHTMYVRIECEVVVDVANSGVCYAYRPDMHSKITLRNLQPVVAPCICNTVTCSSTVCRRVIGWFLLVPRACQIRLEVGGWRRIATVVLKYCLLSIQQS